MDRTEGQRGPAAQRVTEAEAGSGASAGGTSAGGTSAGGAGRGDATGTGGVARVVTLTAGDFTLTVNPVDGSEIEPHRPGAEPLRPARRDAVGRAEWETAARPPVLPGSATAAARPVLARDEERERLVRLLARGRSVRLTGPSGSGRSTLLDAVGAACAGLAPDGVVRLSGHGRQQPVELLHALYAAVYDAPGTRPDRTELLARVRDIGAVVLLDDLELGGAALDELLRATPECAYLLAATPDTKAPSDGSHLEEVFLGGLAKADGVLLLEALTGRALTEEETAWAGDLRFASEGLPLRSVQAAALLRQRDELNRRDENDDEEEPGVFEERPRDAAHVPLPTLAEAAAPAELLASRVSESARAALRIACALGGEMPHHTHLPALVGDTHADTAVAELLECGLITPVGPRYRLAAGVARQLEEAGYGDGAAEEARTAARHYAWWTGHSSVAPERIAAEADAVLAALAGADVVAAVLLARTAAPAFAASLHWEAWERVLRSGAEAARKAGEVAEQAYFHHELGVLALCEGRLERARAELEASIGLRGALADRRGTVAGRRALALVTDREAAVEVSPPLRLEAPVAPPVAPPVSAAGGRPGAVRGSEAVTQVVPAVPGGAVAPMKFVKPVKPVAPVTPVAPVVAVAPVAPAMSVIHRQEAPTAPTSLADVFEEAFPTAPKQAPLAAPVPVPGRGPVRGPAAAGGRRRTALLAGAGVLTVAVLGTVVGLAVSSSDSGAPSTPAVSSTPTSGAETGASGGGNDPAQDPGTGGAAPSASGSPSESAGPGAGPGAGAGPRTGTTPSSRTPSGHQPTPVGPGTPTRGPASSSPPVVPDPGPDPSPSGSKPGPDPTTSPPTTPSVPPSQGSTVVASNSAE